MNRKKVISTIILLSVVSTMVAGCGKKTESKDAGANNENKNITLKYWIPMHNNAAKIMKSFAENEVYKELEKRTGVHIEFIHPAQGQGKEQFNLMINSKDLPDMISHYGKSYPGGPDKAVDDGVYLKLNDLIDKNAPNIKKIRESNSEIARQTITDAGNIWGIPCIQTTEEEPWWGPIIRTDWLDELGLKKPTTIDEWYNVLKTLKEKKNLDAPLLMDKTGVDWGGIFLGAYDIGYEFYKKEGKVKYGFTEPGFKEYLTTMNKWYKEGLIDKDFATRDTKSWEAMITSQKSAAHFGTYGGSVVYANAIKTTSPNANFEAAVYPSLKPGEKVHFREKDEFNKGVETVITTACKNPAEAVKWLDYGFSDEGSMLFNYGIENVSYKMVDGKPKFTDIMLDAAAAPEWKYKVHIGAYKRDWKAFPDVEKSEPAMATFAKAEADYVMPPVNLTDEENRKYSSIMSEINTYKDEKILKFIMGVEPLDKFDDYVKQIKKMGIDEAIKIQQAALDRYNNRK
jgi:putative aldouronate transport system substrate-binding protein